MQLCEVERRVDAQHRLLCIDVPYNKVMCGDVQESEVMYNHLHYTFSIVRYWLITIVETF